MWNTSLNKYDLFLYLVRIVFILIGTFVDNLINTHYLKEDNRVESRLFLPKIIIRYKKIDEKRWKNKFYKNFKILHRFLQNSCFIYLTTALGTILRKITPFGSLWIKLCFKEKRNQILCIIYGGFGIFFNTALHILINDYLFI